MKKTPNSNKASPLRNMGVGRSLSLFGLPALLLMLEMSLLIPAFVSFPCSGVGTKI